MTDSERKAAVGTLRPLRNNARGMAMMSILMAVMINFVADPIAMLMPVIFGIASLGMAIKARKGVGSMSKMLATGTVTEIRTVPKRMSTGRGWELGMFYAMRSRALNGVLVEGVPASLTVLPETKHVLAVNGTPLRSPVQLISAPGAVMSIAPSAVQQAPIAASMPVDEELPPPPDDWVERSCQRCGQKNASNALFCEKCGMRIEK
jgi:hypothetical protein